MDYEYVKKLLHVERQRVERSIRRIEENTLSMSLKESIGEDSTYDNHPADIGTETYERSKDIALRDNARIILRQVERAEKKVEEGTYGYCDECGSPICEERLQILPYATTCVNCEKMRGIGSRTRPIEEEVLGVPFARTFKDREDSVATDGEDIWQKVAQYGTSNTPGDFPYAHNAGDCFEGSQEIIGAVIKEDKIGVSYEESRKRYVYPEEDNPQESEGR